MEQTLAAAVVGPLVAEVSAVTVGQQQGLAVGAVLVFEPSEVVAGQVWVDCRQLVPLSSSLVLLGCPVGAVDLCHRGARS